MISIKTTVGGTFDEVEATLSTVLDKLIDADLPGALVEFSPDEAELAGAFTENALDADAAWDSVIDTPLIPGAGE